MKGFWLTFMGLMLGFRLFAQTPGELSDVTHYQINLDISDFTNQQISGSCLVTFKALQTNQQSIQLELWNLTVDSVVANHLTSYTYDGSIISVNFDTILSLNENRQVHVYYHGHPMVDPTGWGGFLFSSGIAFNLGVGFGANPHNLGKAWFPCVDTFTDRASYEYFIKTGILHTVTCSGIHINSYPEEYPVNKFIHHWKLDEAIPTYLASVAVSQYQVIIDSIQGIERMIPVSHYLQPSIAGNTNSFVHLPDALHAFESKYGPYRWPRIGYVNTPVGAMEHVCNIAFPTGYIDGTLSGERTMAHELAHAWFGNLITCETAEDMWINEGWASFLEEDFMEAVYGKEAAKDYARSRHALNLRTLHHEEGHLPLYGIGNEDTYSSTIYKKGADMAHSLRGYLGDSVFYAALTQLMQDSAFNDVSVSDLNTYLSDRSGIDLQPFFDAHIYQPGWLHFSIDSTVLIPAGNGTAVTIYVRQRKKDADNYLIHTRLKFGFLKPDLSMQYEWFSMMDTIGNQSYILDFDPIDIILDPAEDYMDATTDQWVTMKAGTTGTLADTYFKYEIDANSDSAYVRVEQNWIAPDNFKTPHPNYILSNSRYWKIQGFIPPGFSGMFKFHYSNETTSSGMLDYTWFTYPMSADSLVLLYRTGPEADWQEISFIRQGFTRVGYLSTTEVEKGEYTLAFRDRSLNIDENVQSNKLKIFPNPASDSITIDKNSNKEIVMQVFDSQGRMVESMLLPEGKYTSQIPLHPSWKGLFTLRFLQNGKTIHQSKIVVN